MHHEQLTFDNSCIFQVSFIDVTFGGATSLGAEVLVAVAADPTVSRCRRLPCHRASLHTGGEHDQLLATAEMQSLIRNTSDCVDASFKNSPNIQNLETPSVGDLLK